MVPGQEANSDNLGKFFRFSTQKKLYVECTKLESPRCSIQFRDKVRKFPKFFVFLSYRKNFEGTKNEFELAMVNEPSVFELLRFGCI